MPAPGGLMALLAMMDDSTCARCGKPLTDQGRFIIAEHGAQLFCHRRWCRFKGWLAGKIWKGHQ